MRVHGGVAQHTGRLVKSDVTRALRGEHGHLGLRQPARPGLLCRQRTDAGTLPNACVATLYIQIGRALLQYTCDMPHSHGGSGLY